MHIQQVLENKNGIKVLQCVWWLAGFPGSGAVRCPKTVMVLWEVFFFTTAVMVICSKKWYRKKPITRNKLCVWPVRWFGFLFRKESRNTRKHFSLRCVRNKTTPWETCASKFYCVVPPTSRSNTPCWQDCSHYLCHVKTCPGKNEMLNTKHEDILQTHTHTHWLFTFFLLSRQWNCRLWSRRSGG